MKHLISTLVFSFFSTFLFSQTSATNIGSIISDAYEITSLSDYSFMYEDVMTYFNLNNEYETPLKKSNFMKSAEYRGLSDSLNKLRESFKNKICFITFNGKNENDKVQYDLKSKGFYFYTGYNYYPNLKSLPNCYEGGEEFKVKIKFSNLQTPIRNNKLSDYDKLTGLKPSPMSHIFIPMSTETGEEIESASNYPRVYIVFQPVSIIKNKEVNLYYKSGVGEAYETEIYLNVLVKSVILAVDDKVVYNKGLLAK